MGGAAATLIEITGSALLFCLIFGMSATVDINSLRAQLKNQKAIGTALCLQFIVLPFVGFVVVKVLGFEHATGITLLVVTASPGGSYSNWWCSMFNADLALSVTLTAISTVLSAVTLPLNLFLYARIAYADDLLDVLKWRALLRAIFIVIAAIGAGLWASAARNSPEFHRLANRVGNAAGVCLVIFSAIMSNTDAESRLWDRDLKFYGGVAFPCIFGLVFANFVTTGIKLVKPERVTTSIECCYQNVGIATSLAMSMFQGDQLAQAIAVPFYYGIVEAFALLIYCVGAWKAGWTKAPTDVSFLRMLFTSYEILETEMTAEEMTKAAEDEEYCYVQHDDSVVPVPKTEWAPIE